MAQYDGPLEPGRFKNIDEPSGYSSCLQALRTENTRNFVVDFGDEEAFCAVDLLPADFKTLLNSPRPDRYPARWINFYGGDLSQKSIEILVAHYRLSPRLIGLLCSKASTESTTLHRRREDVGDEKDGKSRSSSSETISDVDMALEILKGSLKESRTRKQLNIESSHFGQIVDDIIHFSSIDVGQRYLCVSYNSLYAIPGVLVESGPEKPYGKRIFTALVFCDDGTVISISETPFPTAKDYHEKILEVSRRLTMNVFVHLSKLAKKQALDSLTKVTIRNFDEKPNNYPPLEHASLLFYYLFDDWISHYSLVARKEHPYGQILEKIRARMFEKADVELIEVLHQVGRQVSLLKRIYQSIQSIIKRILERQQVLLKATTRPQLTPQPSISRVGTVADFDPGPDSNHGPTASVSSLGADPHSVGVLLSHSANARFERLLDRISLFALSEIEEFLSEKEALVLMCFNLIALKESQAVERLTRNTVAISKVAAFFLPLSLMTAYFSTSIPQLQKSYDTKTYWFTFLVVVVLTFIGMIGFEFATGRVEGRTNYRSLTRIAWGKALGRRSTNKSMAIPSSKEG